MIEKMIFLKPGTRIDVHSKQTATAGKFVGVMINERGEPTIALDIGSGPPVAYGFGEVKKVEILGPQDAPNGVREVERAVL
jgi:hypothetical protein